MSIDLVKLVWTLRERDVIGFKPSPIQHETFIDIA